MRRVGTALASYVVEMRVDGVLRVTLDTGMGNKLPIENIMGLMIHRARPFVGTIGDPGTSIIHSATSIGNTILDNPIWGKSGTNESILPTQGHLNNIQENITHEKWPNGVAGIGITYTPEDEIEYGVVWVYSRQPLLPPLEIAIQARFAPMPATPQEALAHIFVFQTLMPDNSVNPTLITHRIQADIFIQQPISFSWTEDIDPQQGSFARTIDARIRAYDIVRT